MSFTEQFTSWLNGSSTRNLLIEVGVKTGGAETTRYLSSMGLTTAAADTPSNTVYQPRVKGGVRFSRSLDVSGRGGSLGFGTVDLDNADGALDGWLTDIWDGRSIILLMGDAAWARSSYVEVFKGVVANLEVRDRNTLSLKLRDILAPLNAPVSSATIGGSGDNKGALLPLTLGEVFNVQPVLVNAATQQYKVHTGAVEQIIEVRDNGIPVAITADASTGSFTLSAARYGQITADVQGAKVSGEYRNDVGGLIEWVATALGDGDKLSAGDFDTSALSAFRSACPQPVGVWIEGRTNRLQIMQELAASVGATVTAGLDGKLRIVRTGFTAPTRDIRPYHMLDGSFGPVFRPAIVGAVRLNGGRNWTPQTGAALAGGLNAGTPPLMENDFITRSASDSNVLTDYKQNATPDAVDTLLIVESDIDAECTRRLNLWKQPRMVYQFEGLADLLDLELGQTVTVTHPRLGLASGAAGVITQLDVDFVQARVNVEVLV